MMAGDVRACAYISGTVETNARGAGAESAAPSRRRGQGYCHVGCPDPCGEVVDHHHKSTIIQADVVLVIA